MERFRAALLFTDISGFTALTERLQARGREGAEEIAATINRVFTQAIKAIEVRGGSIVTFGGDALFAVFPGACAVSRAVAAAEAIQGTLARRGQIATSAGPVALGVSQAIHYGDVHGLHLGHPERRHYAVVGRAVVALARLEARASGRLLISAAARARSTQERCSAAAPSPFGGTAPSANLRLYLPERLLPGLTRAEGEFRRVGVLFLETTTAEAERLNAFYVLLADALDRRGGVLLKSDLSPAGTKWLCVFGVPQAHEEDPDRGARTAIDLLAATPTGILVRGGLHAGVVANVIVGTRTRRCFDVMGDVVNTAARALQRARWGEVVVTESTRPLLSGVETTPRGVHEVKGKSAPLELHALQRAGAIFRGVRETVPMIGRDAELQRLVDALTRARRGQGVALGIKGDPGLGKSRLKHEAAKVARAMGFEVHEGRATSFEGMAYWTVAALLRSALGLPEDPSREAVLGRVAAAAEELCLKATDRHHLADVLGARYDDSPIPHLQQSAIRLNAMIAVRAFATSLARVKPRLLVFEDMHWADGASTEAAAWLAGVASQARYVVLLLYRPGYEPPKGSTEIELHELRDDAVDALMEAHFGQTPALARQRIRERSGGNPFYVEELSRQLAEAGIEGDPGEVPGSIEAVIATRLDHLAPHVRRVIQVASVLGRTFGPELLASIDAHLAVEDAVTDLLARGLLLQESVVPKRRFTFKHALIIDVAYAGILGERRRRLHRRAADVMGDLAEEDAALLPLVAHHRERAGERGRALAAYLSAAREAERRFAPEEAQRLFLSYLRLEPRPGADGIEALNSLGHLNMTQGRREEAEFHCRRALDRARRARRVDLAGAALAGLGLVLDTFGKPAEARRVFEEGIGISRRRRDRRLEASLLGHLASIDRDQGEAERAVERCQQALDMWKDLGDRRGEGRAAGTLAGIWLTQGRLREARHLFEEVLAIQRECGDRRLEGITLGNLASTARMEGRLQDAHGLYLAALEVARRVGDRVHVGRVLGNLANVHLECGRPEQALTTYQAALEVAREVGNRTTERIVLSNMAVTLHELGRLDEARVTHESAIAMAHELGSASALRSELMNLGNVYMELGLIEDARTTYARALANARRVGDRGAEGWLLGKLAAAGLYLGRAPEELQELAREAEAVLREMGDRLGLGHALCTHAFLRLAQGLDAGSIVERIRTLAGEMGVGERSPLGEGLGVVERAQARLRAGLSLVCGRAPHDISPGKLRWLRRHRPGLLPSGLLAD